VKVLAVIVVIAGIGLLMIGRARYVRSRQLIEAGEFRPAAISVDLSVAMFVVAGLLAIVFIIVGMER